MRPMEQYEKILILENEIEAELLDSVLTERDIPIVCGAITIQHTMASIRPKTVGV